MAIWTNDSATSSSWVDDTFVQGGSAATVEKAGGGSAFNTAGTYPAINVSSSGTGLTVTVTVSAHPHVVLSGAVASGGQGYEVDDTVTVDAGGNFADTFTITGASALEAEDSSINTIWS